MFVFADNEDDNNNNDNTLSVLDENSNPGITQVVLDITNLLNNNETDIPADDIDVIDEPILVNVERSVRSVTPNNTNGFKSVILSIIGNYDTVVTDYTYQNNSNYYSHSIDIESDYVWWFSCGIFAMLLYCTFRTIGGICSRF